MRTGRSLVTFLTVFFIFFVLFTTNAAASRTITVDDDGPADYTTIQNAVDNAVYGDTIIVKPGTYHENLDVYKSLTIRSENGPAETSIQALTSSDHVFYVTADSVTISGFSISGAGGYPNSGIYLNGVEGCIIENNNLSNNYYGIKLYISSYNTLTGNNASNNYFGIWLESSSDYNTLNDNIASNNYFWGIDLDSSSNNTLAGNNAESNKYYGIFLSSSSNNTLIGNNASNNEGLSTLQESCGIRLCSSSDYNTLTGNNASNNGLGIRLDSSSDYNTLTGNNATSNNDCCILLSCSSNNTLISNNAESNNYCWGIELWSSSNNTLTGNKASNNYYGIGLYSSSNNTLTGNKASNNSNGIELYSSSNNTLTDNKASNNGFGIYLSSSINNTLTGNNASNNCCGIYLDDSSNYTFAGNNIIYNNYFNNTNNIGLSNSPDNIWNTTKAAGINIIGSPCIGGNFWAKPDGTGFSQTHNDTDGDGICEEYYDLGDGNIDYLPLAEVSFHPDTSVLPISTSWNLISIPLVSEDSSIGSVLSQVSGSYSIVWAYDASDSADPWKKYDPSVPFGNDLSEIKPGRGYWIMMTADDILSVTGSLPEKSIPDMGSGWNLIGYNSLTEEPVADALSSVSGDYSIVWAYDASDSADPWKKYDPSVPFGNDLTDMGPGKGYWIMMEPSGE